MAAHSFGPGRTLPYHEEVRKTPQRNCHRSLRAVYRSLCCLIVALAVQSEALDREAAAQAASKPEPGPYAGVTPGRAQNTPPKRATGGRVSLLTWPGFQAHRSGASRFFVQTSGFVETATKQGSKRFEVLLKNVRVQLRNNRRPLDTRFFNTPVTMAHIERRGRNQVAVVFELRAEVTPRVHHREENGFHFVFVEFPAGQFI